MSRAKVKLGLGNKSLNQKLEDGETIIDKMGTSPVFGGVVDLTPIINAYDALIAARTARNAAQQEAISKTEELYAAIAFYEDQLRDLAVEAETVSDYDAAALEGGGFDIFFPGINGPVSSLDTPVILEMVTGGSSGKINVNWTTVKGAIGYNVYIGTNPNQEDNFQFVETVTRSRTTLTGLNTGTKYWLQVVAFGHIAKSDPSDPASSVAR